MNLSVTDSMIDQLGTINDEADSSLDNSSDSMDSADSALRNKMGCYEGTFGDIKPEEPGMKWIKVDTFQEEALEEQLSLNKSSAHSNDVNASDLEESKELRPIRKNSFIALGTPKMKPPLAHLMMKNH